MSITELRHEVIRASAGSGKTHQLTNRFIGLLADGVDPETILATTFTRKAAGEILDRVLYRLAQAASDDHEACKLARQVGRADLTRERCTALLKKVLSCLHRLRIATLDAFAVQLAGHFSLEIGLPPGWTICEEAEQTQLKLQALENLLQSDPEFVRQLLPALYGGELRRSVHDALLELVDQAYDAFLVSKAEAWGKLTVPDLLPEGELQRCLEALRTADDDFFSDRRIERTRNNNVIQIEQADWASFLASGIANAIASGQSAYYRRVIPESIKRVYEPLIVHARGVVLSSLAEQSKQAYQFLERYHQELWRLKQATGQLRFHEVTTELGRAISDEALSDERQAFRLDGTIDHLLLDEFQDTSLPQWRLFAPIARRVVDTADGRSRSFFCVGDVKQAIYGWRGGVAQIFDTLKHALRRRDEERREEMRLEETRLDESWRSAQPIIDVVNEVFGNLTKFRASDKDKHKGKGKDKDDGLLQGLQAWSKRFSKHTTVWKDRPGYVCLRSGPTQEDGQNVADHRAKHCEYVAKQVQTLLQHAQQGTVGVLCRTNDIVSRMIFELRKLGIDASEEGGSPLVGSPAVDLMLSLFTLADHPDHSIAWFHLKNSPLAEAIAEYDRAAALAADLRRDLLREGYGPFTYRWAKELAAKCDARDLLRLQQLVDIAYDYQSHSTLRPSDFVAWVAALRVADPTQARVRVMTIHSAKGLQFDVVVLPLLEASLKGQPPKLVVERNPETLEVERVCRYANKDIQAHLLEDDRAMFRRDVEGRVEESLSLLYVAMTRAKTALFMYIPGPRTRERISDGWHHLLLDVLSLRNGWEGERQLYEHGDAEWYRQLGEETSPADKPAVAPLPPIQLADGPSRRGLERIAPSATEGAGKLPLRYLFDAGDETRRLRGLLHHAWFQAIEWLDDGEPSDDALRKCFDDVATDYGARLRDELDERVAEFRRWLRVPDVAAVLKRSAYAGPDNEGYPDSLRSAWCSRLAIAKLERERRFLVRDGDSIVSGSFDRIVWLERDGEIVAADIIDFKTDDIAPGDTAAIAKRAEYYRPQLEHYRKAACLLAGLDPDAVSVRLVFTAAGAVVQV